MANYTTLRNGSSGNEVLELQKLLKAQGYNITVDGKYGSQTEGFVKDYQRKNGLTVDGIVGTQTWGTLKPASTTTAPAAPQPTNTFKYEEFKYTDPREGDAYKQAQDQIQEHMNNNKQAPWLDTLNDTINKIMNKEKFSYDLNGDALYQQYKDRYTTQGQMAMMDTMGQASAMTGGYGNSYAQSVGQQTYQGYLQKLNDKVPELYQLALNQYNQEKEDLYNQASLLSTMNQQHMDKYYKELGVLTDERDTIYNQAMDMIGIESGLWADKNEYNYKTSESAKKQAYDTAMSMIALGKTPSAQLLADAGISSEDAQVFVKAVNEQAASSGGSGSGGSGGTGGTGGSGGYDTHGYTTEQIKSLQKNAGITVDGIWGAQTEAAYQRGIRPKEDNGGDSPTNYSEVEALAAELKRKGAPNSEIIRFITNSVNGKGYGLRYQNKTRDIQQLTIPYNK